MKRIETEDVVFEINDGILFCSFNQNLTLDIVVAKRIVKNRLEFTEGAYYPILIDFTNMKSTTKEAREYMSLPGGGLKGIISGAFISNSVVTTVIVNLFFKINKPLIPSKFFTNKEDALNWLTQLKNSST